MDYLAQKLINYVHDNKGSLAAKAGMIIILCAAYRALAYAVMR